MRFGMIPGTPPKEARDADIRTQKTTNTASHQNNSTMSTILPVRPTIACVALWASAIAAQTPASYQLETDWLIDPAPYTAELTRDANANTITLGNGLVSRTWKLRKNATTISLANQMSGTELLRAFTPEVAIGINGSERTIGGLDQQPNRAYLKPSWSEELPETDSPWKLAAIHSSHPTERFPWKRVRHHAPDATWPPRGKAVHFEYQPESPELAGLVVTIHYELYDGLPAFSKWLSVANQGEREVNIDTFKAEILAFVPYEDPVEFREGVALRPPDFHVETDFAFGGFSVKNSQKHSVHWLPDSEWKTQVNWALKNPSRLEVRPPQGPDQTLAPGETFESFRAFELIYDDSSRDRQGLALRRMYRTIAPWVTENPLVLHVVSTDDTVVQNAIDQAVDCGFEMVSLSFGSGLNMEDETHANLAKFARLAQYAESRGIHLGGYSLLSSRRIQPDRDNIVNPETGEPGGQTHGFCPALASPWGQDYFRKLNGFFDGTGFLQFTHDGSYPGDVDAAARPPLQKGANDSQWVQWKIITDFYKKLRSIGAYVRVPDYYYLSGANEAGMGYREVNWSLPRLQQQIHTRQNIFDGTWQKTPSMGWMFVPLTQYHGGGEAATIEPLHRNLDHYKTMMVSNLGAGVQAVYRGHRLYDTPETRETVTRWVNWYKTHRAILESDVIHASSRRADAQDLDWFFHANPQLETRGLAVVYNPLDVEVEKQVPLNVYFTGLNDTARIEQPGQPAQILPINRHYRIAVPVKIAPREFTWIAIKAPGSD